METDAAVLTLPLCRSEVNMLKRRNEILFYVLPWMSVNVSSRTTMGRHVVYTGRRGKNTKFLYQNLKGEDEFGDTNGNKTCFW